MSISRLTKESETRIHSALSEVADRTSRGEAPDDAIVKVATDRGISAGHVRMMVRAYNNGRSLGHIRSNTELAEKAAAFPLADASAILERMFPSEVKTASEKAAAVAVSSDYNMSPAGWLERREAASRRDTLVKSAAAKEPAAETPAYPEDPRRLGKAALAEIGKLQLEHERLKGDAMSACYKVAADVSAVGEYFRQPGAYDINEVRVNARAALGAPGHKLVEHATRMFKIAMAEPKRFTHSVDWTQAPYSLVKQALDTMADFEQKRATLIAFEQELPEKRAGALRPFCQTPENDVIVGSVWDNRSLTKEAIGLAGLTLAGIMGRSAGGMAGKLAPKSKEELVQAQMDNLASPSHEDSLRAIRMQTMIHELMLSDPVISGYDKEAVLEAYNHLSEVAPRAMQTRTMAQALIRKYLEQASAIDPFDIDQALDVESKLTDRDMPTQLMAAQSPGVTREMGPPQSRPKPQEAPKSTNIIDEIIGQQGEYAKEHPVRSELFKRKDTPAPNTELYDRA